MQFTAIHYSQVKEPNLEQLARGRTVYEPPRYMTINTALEQLLEVGPCLLLITLCLFRALYMNRLPVFAFGDAAGTHV